MPEAATEAPKRPAATVVTQENFEQWASEETARRNAQKAPQATVGEDGPVGGNGEDTIKVGEAAADATPAKPEAKSDGPKEFDKRVSPTGNKEVFFRDKWVDEGNFGYRLHLKTEEALKPEREKLTAAEQKAKEAQEARQAAEAEAQALRAKYEPRRDAGPGAPPQLAQFVNQEEWSKAYSDWANENAAFTVAQRTAHEARVRSWEASKADVRKDFPDWDTKVGESKVVVNDPLRDAIYDSEHGPRILLHLAEHPEVATSLNNMPAGRMLREIGRLEASFGKDTKPAPAAAAAPPAPMAEISKAPPPISPLKETAGAANITMRGSDKWHGTYEDFKRARQEGRIK